MRSGVSLCSILLLACGTGDTPPPAEEPQLAVVPLSGERPRAMRNCPVSVPGARTQVARAPDGSVLTITADREVAQREIVARMQRTLALGAQRGAAPRHSGRGGGPEVIGYCPVFLTGTAVSYQPIEGGISVHLRSQDPLEAGVVQARVEARARALNLEVPRS